MVGTHRGQSNSKPKRSDPSLNQNTGDVICRRWNDTTQTKSENTVSSEHNVELIHTGKKHHLTKIDIIKANNNNNNNNTCRIQ